MLKPTDLAKRLPGLENDADLARFLDQDYDHQAQMRNISKDGIASSIYPTSTQFDGDRT